MVVERCNGAWRRLLGVLSCACLVLQLLLVPVHVALEEHVLLVAEGEQAHSHAAGSHGEEDARHEHEPARNADPDPDHRPHPLEDHLEELAELAVVPALVDALPAPAPAGPGLLGGDPPSRAQPAHEERGPRPRPPRLAGAARAPPLVV